mmetsp:Transcript_2944/g.9273  ORF Transcript_2944/g.9273 Transcript_2944/m.9273 type:complete len:212 (+) Transcript_2944:35-670(+)
MTSAGWSGQPTWLLRRLRERDREWWRWRPLPPVPLARDLSNAIWLLWRQLRLLRCLPAVAWLRRLLRLLSRLGGGGGGGAGLSAERTGIAFVGACPTSTVWPSAGGSALGDGGGAGAGVGGQSSACLSASDANSSPLARPPAADLSRRRRVQKAWNFSPSLTRPNGNKARSSKASFTVHPALRMRPESASKCLNSFVCEGDKASAGGEPVM